MTSTITSVAELIQAARHGRSQKEFAAVLGVTQPQLSRYLTGKYNPPAKVINLCMREAHIGNGEVSAPSADDLAQQVRTALASPDKEQARIAVASLLAAVTNDSARA
jgi:transcriptional regulator with XRE-family HTH domain